MVSVASRAFDLIAIKTGEQLNKQKEEVLLFIGGKLDIFPEPVYEIKADSSCALPFYVLGLYHLNDTLEFDKARDMFLSDLALRSSNFCSWLGLAVANIRILETQFYGLDITNR